MAISGFNGIPLNTMQTFTASNSAATTLSVPDGADFILIEGHQHDLRIRFDGTDPTSHIGFKIPKDTPTTVYVGIGTTIKIIAVENSPAVYWQAWRVMRDNNA